MLFFEVDERGCLYSLSAWQGCTAPLGGTVVMATTRTEAEDLYMRYHSGETELKQTILIPGYETPCKNIICER